MSGYRPIAGTDYVYYDTGDISDERRIFRRGGTGVPVGECVPTGDEPGWDVYRWGGRKVLGHVRTYRQAVEVLLADQARAR